jgi:hypothetical protein
LRRYTAALKDTFNDIHVKRFSETNIEESDYIVPISFASAQKAYTLTDDDYTKYRESKYNVLPRMALSFDGMSKAPERDTNKLNKTLKINDDGKNITYTYNSVAWTFDFTLHILADTFTDLTMIVEQIVPMFNPTYTLKIKDIEFHSEYTNIPVKINEVSWNLDTDLSMDDNIRLVTAEISLSLNGNLYPPIKDGKIINHVIANVYNGFDPSPKGEL